MKHLEELTSIFAKGDKFLRHKFVSPVFETIKKWGYFESLCQGFMAQHDPNRLTGA